MSKELFVTSTPHETKLAIVEDDQLVEVYFERENEYTLAGSIYKGKVTRVLPGMQSAFVDVGLERDAFLYVTDFLEEVEDSEEFEPVTQPAPPRRDQPRHSRSRSEESRSFTPAQPQPGAMQIEGDFTGEADDVDAQAAPAIDTESGNAAEPAGNDRPEQGDRGSRRWRGRRGRRRGRGTAFSESKFAHPEQKGSEAQGNTSEGEEDQLEVRAESFEENNENAHTQQSQEIEDQSSGNEEDAGHTEPRALGPEGSDNRPRQQQPRREPRPDRQERSGRRDRPDRQERLERHVRPERTAGREDRAERSARPEPVILPGESLAKFNRKAEPAPSQQQMSGASASQQESRFQLAARRPSTEVREPATLVSASHGILAGESLAKYRQKPDTASSASAAPAQEREAGEQQAPAEAETHQHAAPPSEERDERHGLREDRRHQQEERHVHVEGRHETQEHQSAESSSASVGSHEDPSQAQGTGDYNFRPGSGVIEEEEVAEEEHDSTGLGFDAVEDEYEELEEETLESDTPHHSEQREERAIAAGEGIASAFADEKSQTNQYMSEEVAGQDEEEDEAGGNSEDSGDDNFSGQGEAELEQAHAAAERDHESGDEAEAATIGDPAVVDPDDPNFAGRAELRASAGTAGYQMKTERTGFDPRRRDRKGRGRPPMRRGGGPRRNIPRGPMPQINELLKEGQEILVQIAKEPMAKKGARITSHIALPGRFLVFMPTVNHTGVSRKIGSEEERQRLKRILLSEKGQGHGGFIVRTAASGASEDDLRADIRFLINLWNEIKQRSETSKAPALIYHDLNLVERILRDQVTSTFSNIWVDNEQEYERIVRFTSRFQSSLVKRVKLYSKDTPLFEQFNIQEEINKALKSKVWLKSGGYIVINQTEALVAIDINTGKYVGKTARLEDTIVKTNIDAIKEIVRQIRLRDLGGIIVIDFIDMDERRNRQKVMQALEEALRSDRSPSKVLQFNDFGLVAITRKRVKQSLERTLGTQCVYCTGTGMIKSVTTVCNEIFVELRKMAKHFENQQVMLRVNPEVAKALKDNGGKWLSEMEELLHRTIIVKSDPTQHQEHFDIN